MAVNETATEQTPREKAQEIFEREVKMIRGIITGHEKHFDALVLAIEIFGNDPGTIFSLTSIHAGVIVPTKDINTTLKDIHHRMRTAGWQASFPFGKEYLSWFWRKDDTPLDSPTIRFVLKLADNATCRKVQVGIEKVPIYEIQCEKGEIKEPGDD